MPAAPQTCPTCATSVPEGAERCPACGRVFGEANRCPHCNAVAAVIERGDKTVCAACGKPRTGTVTLGGGTAKVSIVPASRTGREASTSAMMTRARGRTERGLGVFALAGGVLAAALAMALVPGALGVAFAVAGGLIGAGLGAVSIRAGARKMEQARADERRASEMALHELAKDKGGRLTASDAARELKISFDEADDLLTRSVGDGSRIDVDVDDEGVVTFVFRELVPTGPSVRVEPELGPDQEELEQELGEAQERARREV